MSSVSSVVSTGSWLGLELKGRQSQGATLEEAIANIKEAIELYLDTLPIGERECASH